MTPPAALGPALAVVAAAASLGAIAPPALAAPPAGRTYTVNSLLDTPDADLGTAACADSHRRCTLRAALMQANFHLGADRIVLPKGTITLTRRGRDDGAILGDLDVTDSLTLVGKGPAATVIDGNGKVTGDRVIEVLPSAHVTTIADLALRGGKRTDVLDAGGGLYWHGGPELANQDRARLLVHDVSISGNASWYGAGIAALTSAGSDVELDRVSVHGNRAQGGAAGGIAVTISGDGAHGSVHASHVYGNAAYEGAGVVFDVAGKPLSSDGPDEIAGTRIDHNRGGLVGGLEAISSVTTPVVLTDSELDANTASIYGGGLGVRGPLLASAVTIAGNHASLDGGGIYFFSSAVATLTNATIAANVADVRGGGAFVQQFYGHDYANVVAYNPTFAGNTSPAGSAIYHDRDARITLYDAAIAGGGAGASCNAVPWEDTAGGLADDASCALPVGPAGLGLGPLGDHGGPVQTLLPRSGSPLEDAGVLRAKSPLVDARGVTRPRGGTPEIGAVELCLVTALPPATRGPATTVTGPRVTLSWRPQPCAERYAVTLRRGSTTGPLVQSATRVIDSTFMTKALTRGITYFWRVAVTADRSSAVSTWHHFTVR